MGNSNATAATQTKWTKPKCSGDIPVARERHTALVLEGHRMLIMGGRNIKEKKYFNDVYQLNLDNHEWKKLNCTGDIPSPRCSHSAVVDMVGVRMIIFGGIGYEDELNDTYELDLEKLVWRKLKCSGKVPPPRCSHSAILEGNRMIVFGGGSSNATFELNIDTLVWRELACKGAIPTGRHGHTCVYDDGYMVLFGGYHNKASSRDMYKLNLETLEWTEVAPASSFVPAARCGHSAVISSGKMFVFGGDDNQNELCRFDLDTRQWSKITPITTASGGVVPTKRSRHTCVMYINKMILFGGLDGNYLNDVFECEFDLDESWVVPMEETKVEKLVGKGMFGNVYRGIVNNETVAIKKLQSQKISDEPEAYEEFKRELRFNRSLRHPSIVRFKGCCLKEPDLAIITEFSDQGNLREVIARNKGTGRLSFELKLHMVRQIAKGMKYLHSLQPPLIHRDLKPENILVFGEDLGTVKICDFGLAKVKLHTMTLTGIAGTPLYMPPESLVDDKCKIGTAVDVYAFGIIMWEILNEKKPYEGMLPFTVTAKVVKEQLRPPLPPTKTQAERQYVALMTKCWAQAQTERPTFAQILKALDEIKLPNRNA